ncbi:MAG: ABC transporter permease [Ignavibacteriales bacterium]|nr:ABC transporter permease [Ignavibacteriales bacterium]
MSFKLFIARRYMMSKKEAGFITVISAISVVGITVGVAALIVVLSVFNGFNGLVTSILVGFDPHLRITAVAGPAPQRAQLPLNDNAVQGVAPFVSGKAMIVSRSQSKVVFVRGIESSKIEKVCGLKEKMALGNLELQESGGRNLVIGLTLADRLGVVPGDSVWLVSPAGSEQALLGFGAPVMRSFRVSGIYESDNRDYDALYAYTSLRSAQLLFQIGNLIDGYEIRLTDLGRAEDVKADLQSGLGKEYRVESWYDLHHDLYSVMRIERWTAYIILCLIVGVATFNLLGSLTMSVLAKTRDIGILKAMGATNADIIAIFRFEGMLVGIVGTIAGILLGLIVCYLQVRFHLFALDPTVYIIPAIPVEIRFSDFFAVGGAALLLSFLSTIIPSRRAASMLPAEAIRWE